MRPSRSILALVALVVAALALTACGGDGASVSAEGGTTTSNGSATTTTAPCSLTGATIDAKTAPGPTDISLLTDVIGQRQACADRVTFGFRGGASPRYDVQYQSGPFSLGESGQNLAIDGTAFLVVTFPSAAGVDLSDPAAPATYTGPESIHPAGLTHVREIRRLEDFEGVLKWVIGLDEQRPFTAATLTGPPRMSLDIG